MVEILEKAQLRKEERGVTMVVGVMALHRCGYGGHCVSNSPTTIAKATSASSVTMAKVDVD